MQCEQHYHPIECNLFSPWYSWQLALLVLDNNQSLTNWLQNIIRYTMKVKHYLIDFLYTKDCRNSITDLHYQGNISTTRNGHTCRYWNTTQYPKEGHNYCRTPLADQDSPGGPWCYSTDGGWDRCNVPVCSGK
jgi:hypothetical protein